MVEGGSPTRGIKCECVASMRPPAGTPERRHEPRGVPPAEPSRSELVSTIMGSYHEMPGLNINLQQAARLFGIRPRTCRVVLHDLAQQGCLRLNSYGQYVKL